MKPSDASAPAITAEFASAIPVSINRSLAFSKNHFRS
jgi:hypothetical protein